MKFRHTDTAIIDGVAMLDALTGDRQVEAVALIRTMKDRRNIYATVKGDLLKSVRRLLDKPYSPIFVSVEIHVPSSFARATLEYPHIPWTGEVIAIDEYIFPNLPF